MQILFTKRSKLVASVLGEPVTHVALRWDDYVIHSNTYGVHIEPYIDFQDHNQIVYTIKVLDNLPRLLRLLAKYNNSRYDFGAFAYLGAYFLLRRVGLPLPKKNLWQSSGMFLCTEWVTQYVDDKEDSMITPYGLYLRMTKST